MEGRGFSIRRDWSGVGGRLRAAWHGAAWRILVEWSSGGAGTAGERGSVMTPLTEDEFRLLAYLRGYADGPEQHLDPGWVRAQLEFSEGQMRKAARGLVARGLVEIFEWSPSKLDLIEHPEIGERPHMPDIRVTEYGWNYLRPSET